MPTQKAISIRQNLQNAAGRFAFLHFQQIGNLAFLSLGCKLRVARHAVQCVVVVDLRGRWLIAALLLISIAAARGPVAALLIPTTLLIAIVSLISRSIFSAVLIGCTLRSRTISQAVSIQLGHVFLGSRTCGILPCLPVRLLGFCLPRGGCAGRRAKAVDRTRSTLLPSWRLRGIARRAARLPCLPVNRTEAALLLRVVPGTKARTSGGHRGYIRRKRRFLQLLLRLGRACVLFLRFRGRFGLRIRLMQRLGLFRRRRLNSRLVG